MSNCIYTLKFTRNPPEIYRIHLNRPESIKIHQNPPNLQGMVTHVPNSCLNPRCTAVISIGIPDIQGLNLHMTGISPTLRPLCFKFDPAVEASNSCTKKFSGEVASTVADLGWSLAHLFRSSLVTKANAGPHTVVART